MNPGARRGLSAAAALLAVALALGAAAATAVSLSDARTEVADLQAQADALKAREKRPAPTPGKEAVVSPLIEAPTITLAAAALQHRIETAAEAAKGRLVSSKVELGGRDDAKRLALTAELTIGETELQALLFDLETGRPYLFVESVEARAGAEPASQEPRQLSVSLAVAGQWSATP